MEEQNVKEEGIERQRGLGREEGRIKKETEKSNQSDIERVR